VDWPLRFALPDHDCVSGPKAWSRTGSRTEPAKRPKGLVGRCIFIR
jgi:hypothetical protein